MRKILFILLLYSSTGCIITKHNDLNYIIDKNVRIYRQYDIEPDNIAAILKSYSNLISSKNYNEIRFNTNKFIDKLKNENISENYPIKASETEIRIIKEFLEDIVKYINDMEIKRIRYHINQALKVYIVEIIYEE